MGRSNQRPMGFPCSRWAIRRRAGLGLLIGVALSLVAAVAVSCGGSSSSSTTPSPSTTASSTEAPSNTVWLCRPGLPNNPCEGDLTTTVVSADGSTAVENIEPAKDPPIDCFYVYPTVSDQTTLNADLTIDPEETAVAVHQAARFSQVCKVYAPMYRQLTLKAILTPGADTEETRAVAYSDVLSAWQDYLAHYNDGRGVVFIGHSQGTMMLTHLIATEIDPNPSLRSQLVSAILLGGNVTVAKGQDVGGDFQNVPACRSLDQTGCVVAYSSFNEPPPADSFFGRVGVGPSWNQGSTDNLEVLCVNPASPSGGTGPLQMEFATAPFPGTVGQWLRVIPSAPTPWMAYPGQYIGHCESADGANWLQVDSTNLPGETRPVISQLLGPAWGLHLYDMTVAMGNLVDMVRDQSAVFSP